MIPGLISALSSMHVAQAKVDVASNNLANVSTTAFKASRVTVQDSGSTGTARGVRVASIDKSCEAGSLEATSNCFDLAIERDGFFAVVIPDGSTAYTRDGNFNLDAQGRLVTSLGYILSPVISVPGNALSVYISPQGAVSVLYPGSSTPSVIGTIETVTFKNPGGLFNNGNNVFLATEASGPPVSGTPGEGGHGALLSGFLETSNVDISKELVGLMLAQRAYQLSAKTARAYDDMLGVIVNIKR